MLYFLGSSVTYGSANGGRSFVEELQEKFGYSCVKEAVSGTTLCHNDSTSYVQRMLDNLDKNARVAHFIVQLSTNDITQNKPFGEIIRSKEVIDFDVKTVFGAME